MKETEFNGRQVLLTNGWIINKQRVSEPNQHAERSVCAPWWRQQAVTFGGGKHAAGCFERQAGIPSLLPFTGVNSPQTKRSTRRSIPSSPANGCQDRLSWLPGESLTASTRHDVLGTCKAVWDRARRWGCCICGSEFDLNRSGGRCALTGCAKSVPRFLDQCLVDALRKQKSRWRASALPRYCMVSCIEKEVILMPASAVVCLRQMLCLSHHHYLLTLNCDANGTIDSADAGGWKVPVNLKGTSRHYC